LQRPQGKESLHGVADPLNSYHQKSGHFINRAHRANATDPGGKAIANALLE
jgi:hypothetical protein